MKITSSLFIAASVFCFVACSEGEKDNTTASEATETTMPADNTNPYANPEADGGNIQSAGQATAPATGEMLNPPHGEPGHRCDIQVGAPLSSASANGGATQINTAPANTTAPQTNAAPVFNPTTAPAQNNGNVAVNPPHGQPGHDCSVQVGAPLNK